MRTLHPLQMEKLKKIGVDTTKSSMVLIYELGDEAFSWSDVEYFNERGDIKAKHKDNEDIETIGGDTRLVPMIHKRDRMIEVKPVLYERGSGDYHDFYNEECGVFTLQEIIELLPGEVKDKKGGDPYHIEMIISGGFYKFSIRRREGDCLVGTHLYKNPLDATFDVLAYIYGNKLNRSRQCPKFPFFGATYPDARCIDGYLWDLDKVNEKGELYGEGETPCPFCNFDEFVEHDPFSIEDWLYELEPYEFVKTQEGADYMKNRIEKAKREWYEDYVKRLKGL